MRITVQQWPAVFVLCLAACGRPTALNTIWTVGHAGTGDAILAINPTTLEQQAVVRLDQFVSDAGLSPNENRLLYISGPIGNGATWLAGANGSNPIQVPLEFAVYGFVWLDDNRVVFVGLNDPNSSNASLLWTLYDINLRRTSRLVWKGPWIDPTIYFAHHSNRRAILYKDGGQDVMVFARLEIRGDVLEMVTESQVNPSLMPQEILASNASATPDGRQIAFGAQGGPKNNDVFVASDFGQTVKQLTNFQKDYGLSSLGDLAISPDGSWVIAQVSLDLPHTPYKGTGAYIALVSADGKSLKYVQQIANGIHGHFVWSPDSRYVAVGLGSPGINTSAHGLELINIQTNEIKQVATDSWIIEVFDWH